MMKWLKLSKLLFSIFLLLYLLIIGGLVGAEEIALKEVVTSGLIHNPTLQVLEDNISQLERDLASLKAQLDWQVDITGNFDKGEVNDSVPLSNSKEDVDQLEIGIQGKKSFSSGFSIKPTITFTEEEPYDFDNLTDKYNLSLGISHPLYPSVPTEVEQKYYSTYNDLLKARDKLNWQQENKLIDFIQRYLELVSLQDNLELARENRQLSQNNLNLVLEQTGNKITYLHIPGSCIKKEFCSWKGYKPRDYGYCSYNR